MTSNAGNIIEGILTFQTLSLFELSFVIAAYFWILCDEHRELIF